MKITGIKTPKGLDKRPFFNRAVGRAFDIHADHDVAEIDLYDEIGFFGISAKDFKKQLDGISASTIKLRINSPGGNVFDGIAMFNDLVDHPAIIEVEVTGIAASAASLIAMAGDTITIAENAFLMIHNAWGIVIGNRHDMDDVAKVLEKIDGALALTYANKTGMDRDEIADLMDAETWLTAEEAVDQGFADDAGEEAEASARFDLSTFKNTPEVLLTVMPKQADFETKRDAEHLLKRDAGLSAKERKRFISLCADTTRDAGELTAALQQLTQTIQGDT